MARKMPRTVLIDLQRTLEDLEADKFDVSGTANKGEVMTRLRKRIVQLEDKLCSRRPGVGGDKNKACKVCGAKKGEDCNKKGEGRTR